MHKKLKSCRGNMLINAAGLMILTVMIIGFALNAFPVFIKQCQLDTYASELKRVAENSGTVGEETSRRAERLSEETGLHPNITWSQTGKIQLDNEFSVKCTIETDIGGQFGHFPVTLTSIKSGRSEIYWK